jgi:hypothetical protein
VLVVSTVLVYFAVLFVSAVLTVLAVLAELTVFTVFACSQPLASATLLPINVQY